MLMLSQAGPGCQGQALMTMYRALPE